MHYAAHGGHFDIVVKLMNAGADVNAKNKVSLKRRITFGFC